EDRGVLGQRDAPRGLVERVEVDVVGALVDELELRAGEAEPRALLAEREAAPAGRIDVGDRRGRQRLGAPEVRRRAVPAVRAGEVDELAGGEVDGEVGAGLLLELLPAGVADRRALAPQMVHRSRPFRPPMPSESGEAVLAGAPVAGAAPDHGATGGADSSSLPA